jgi:large subunit ribosomal protein L22
MEAKATARFVRIAPRKVRFVIDSIRGKNAQDALDILKFTPNAAAKVIEKVVKSAMANAENNFHLSSETLKVVSARVDEGPRLKRIQPRAMGRAYRILKRTSHISVILEESELQPKRAQRRETAKPAKPARRAAPKAKTGAEATAAEPVKRTRRTTKKTSEGGE